jgi:hypothetical protein
MVKGEMNRERGPVNGELTRLLGTQGHLCAGLARSSDTSMGR